VSGGEPANTTQRCQEIKCWQAGQKAAPADERKDGRRREMLAGTALAAADSVRGQRRQGSKPP